MTRKQIEIELNVQRPQRDWAKHHLDTYYYELEAQGEEMEWINRYLKHKRAVEWLEQQVPDDSQTGDDLP